MGAKMTTINKKKRLELFNFLLGLKLDFKVAETSIMISASWISEKTLKALCNSYPVYFSSGLLRINYKELEK